MVKVKVKFFLSTPQRHTGGLDILDVGEWVRVLPQQLSPSRKSPWYLSNRVLGRPQG